MRSKLSGLAVLGVLLSTLTAARGEEWLSTPDGCGCQPVCAVPPPRVHPWRHRCHRLWSWLTYHSTRTPCIWHGCTECRRGFAPVCQPHLYEYFLYQHPGCGYCGVQPVAAWTGQAAASAQPTQERRKTQERPEELPRPRPSSSYNATR